MRRIVGTALVVALIALMGFVVIANASSPADVAVSTRISAWVDPAREQARRMAGPAGWWPMPFRLGQAGCSPDGLVIFAFNGFLLSEPSYAVMQLPAATDTGVPAPVVIASLSRAELQDPARGLSAVLGRSCT
jgi:hypothetical protein